VRSAWVCLVLCPALAWAKADGIATTSCSGCHGSAPVTSVTLTGPSGAVAVGATVTLTVTIQSAGIAVGGMWLTSEGVGTFTPGSGEKINGQGVSHSMPKTATNGTVVFTTGWTTTSTPDGADFNVAVVGGNGDDRTSGDETGSAYLTFTWGCTGVPYYVDFDGDGHGNALAGIHMRCGPTPGYSALGDDCDDNDATVYPGAPELCDGRDNNCNGQIDEGLTMAMTWPDNDGDTYGDIRAASSLGCSSSHRSSNNTDCDDTDPNIHPGAMEVCNGKDDDCNGLIDDGVEARCGTGWCARIGPTCDPAMCTPGEPRAEICNDFDDDCDGVIDNGELCGPNGICYEGQCYSGDAPLDGGTSSGTGGGGAGAGPGGGTSSTVPDSCQSVPDLLSAGALAWFVGRRRRRGNRV
jgi:hypothetical protein